jgi:hypothetical protein
MQDCLVGSFCYSLAKVALQISASYHRMGRLRQNSSSPALPVVMRLNCVTRPQQDSLHILGLLPHVKIFSKSACRLAENKVIVGPAAFSSFAAEGGYCETYFEKIFQLRQRMPLEKIFNEAIRFLDS